MGNYHVAIPFVDWRRRRDEAEYCDHDFGVLTKTSPRRQQTWKVRCGQCNVRALCATA